MRTRLTLLALATAAILAAPAAQAGPSPVTISGAWCRAIPAGAMSGACYLTLTARADDRLVAVDTPLAATAEVHSMDMSGGMMRMRKMDDGLVLPKDKAVTLAPNGMHVMLMGPKQAFAKGGKVPLTLHFAKSGVRTVEAEVR